MLTVGNRQRQRGVGLVELMVAITISLVLLTVALSAFASLSAAAVDALQAARLNQQLRAAMSLMAGELQRSGYVNWRAAWGLVDIDGDGSTDIRDFYQAVTPLMREMGGITIGAGGSCILYSYDIDGDGGKSTGDFEHFGFRLSAGAIQMKTTGAHDCNSAGWQAITDGTVTVTEMSFELGTYQDGASHAAMYSVSGGGTPAGPAAFCLPSPGAAGILPDTHDTLCVERRSIRIAIAAQLADDPAVTMVLENRVKLRNDRFNPFQPGG
ncbi:MAG: prepilin-type N-terminal cleavage/methylation domain-containing protein [Bacteroidales bacterium]|nr:prepilin-type N-terminal cleavage/methylation domain-containing protein [Bacteroidales bacterium]